MGKIFSKSEKNISELVSQLKYTRFRFPGGVAKKWGKFCIIVLWWKIFVLKIGPELMAVDELFRSRQSEDPKAKNLKPTLLYSRRWHMEFGRLKRQRLHLLNLIR